MSSMVSGICLVYLYETQNILSLAEMALATLQGAVVPGVAPRYTLKLSHSPDLTTSLPEHRLLPQYVRSSTKVHSLYDVTPQALFRYFRKAGPIVRVRTGVDFGSGRKVCTVEYWDAGHAKYAMDHCRTMHPELQAMKPFSLRTYHPCKLHCGVRIYFLLCLSNYLMSP